MEEVEVAFEIGKTSPAFRSLIGTNNGIGSQGIILDGTAEQKPFWLPKLASGELVASFALTEPGSGSDAASLATTARRTGDHYLLNGTKRFITNAPEAGIFTVMARTDSSIAGARGISAFIVERGAAGLSLGKIDKKMGQRGAHTSCRVRQLPPANDRWQGRCRLSPAMKVLDKDACTSRRYASPPPSGCWPMGLRLGPQAIRPADRGIPAGAGHVRQQDRNLRRAVDGRDAAPA
jgi:acyl-CoA dehydrogenase